MEIFNLIKKYYPFVFFIFIVVLSVFLFQTRSTLKRERAERRYQMEQDSQNLMALKDSISVEFNKKILAWEYSKDNFLVNKLSELAKYNKDLAKQLEKVKGEVIAAIRTEVQGDLGGISTTNGLSVYGDNHYGLNFSSNYRDEGFEQKIVGTSKFFVDPNEQTKKWVIRPDVTVLDTNLTNIKITYGFKELKDQYQVFAISQSPKLKLNDLTGGYFIDKQPPLPPVRPKKWGIGPYVGYGVSSGADNQARFGWSAGFSLHYDVLQFRLGKK